MYHRVAQELHDPWGLAVAPERFEEQISYLKKRRTLMPLRQLVRSLHSGALPADAIAITFDDGYRDNLVNGLPILARYGVAATVFIATGYTGRDEPFWWDELAAMTLASTGPGQHSVQVQGEVVDLTWGAPERVERAGGWRAWEKPRTARQSCYLAIWQRLHDARAGEREEVMKSLRRRLHAPESTLAMPMNAAELRELSGTGLIQLGAHTITHPSLPRLDRDERLREISESRAMCSVLTPDGVDDFAYPFGDVDSAVRQDVADMGFSSACSTKARFLDEEQLDIHLLPRIAVPNVPLRAFVDLITN